MPNKHTEARLLALSGPCPCDGCVFHERCKEGRACLAFLKYQCGSPERVWKETRREPTKKLYRVIYA